MKMKYEKPMVAVDRYELSQSIAGCIISVGLTDSACFLLDNDVPPQMKELAATGWFVDGGCMYQSTEGTSYDGVCIHTQANGALTS